MAASNKEVKKTEQKDKNNKTEKYVNGVLAWSLILVEVIIIAAIWLIVYFALR